MMDVKEILRAKGVVGAGGGGFPTYQKLAACCEVVIVNGAECEPLLYKDQILAELFPGEVAAGLRTAMKAVGARQGVVALKKKYHKAIDALKKEVAGEISLHLLEDIYPAGDEHVLVREVTGKTVPEGGIPAAVSAVVINLETAVNIARAMKGIPVIEKTLTVTGRVKQPVTVTVPLGISCREALVLAGGPDITEYVVIEGGPAMGRIVSDLDAPVTKTTAGYIVMPPEHPLVGRMAQSMKEILGRAKSVCIQCSYCTEGCPRYLLGHKLEPHKVMRAVAFAAENAMPALTQAFLCSECGVCELYMCPMGLSPRLINKKIKEMLRNQGFSPKFAPREVHDHALRLYRQLPGQRFAARIGVQELNRPATFQEQTVTPARVVLPTKQHAGTPAVPCVSAGERVAKGQTVAKAPPHSLGVDLHASINGRVESVSEKAIVIGGGGER